MHPKDPGHFEQRAVRRWEDTRCTAIAAVTPTSPTTPARNRHCPKCQAQAVKRWLEARQTDLLPVEYYHMVFTLPAPIAAIVRYNKAVVYGLLFDIAARPCAPSPPIPNTWARIGMTMVLHTWGSALTHHPHMHGIVPGGGLSPDGER